jgi:mRNA interferase RelE/StbE
MNGFFICYHPLVQKQDFPDLDPAIRKRIRRAINFRLGVSPEIFGKPLKYSFKGLWSLRVGDWRVVYQIKKNEVWVLRICHRRDIYNQPVREVE